MKSSSDSGPCRPVRSEAEKAASNAKAEARKPNYSILDLKALCRGYKYVEEMIKMLPEKPEPVLLAQIFNKAACFSRIQAVQPGSTSG